MISESIHKAKIIGYVNGLAKSSCDEEGRDSGEGGGGDTYRYV